MVPDHYRRGRPRCGGGEAVRQRQTSGKRRTLHSRSGFC